MDWKQHYRSRLTTADEAVKHIKHGSRVLIEDTIAEPAILVDAMVANRDHFRDIEFTQMISFRGVKTQPYLEPGMEKHFSMNAFMIGPTTRTTFAEGRMDFSTSFYGSLPNVYRTIKPLDAALVQVTPPDDEGFCSLGVCVCYTRVAVDTAKLVIAEVNDQMPYTYGDSKIHVSQIDYFIENSHPLIEVPQGKLNDISLEIGRHCAELIEDRSCLQLGMGSIPDAVLACLDDKKDLGIYAELYSDGVLDLYEKGVITGKYCGTHPGIIAAAVLLGTKRLYDFCHKNPLTHFYPIDYMNNVNNIAKNDRMISINGCAQVDLYGQVVSEFINGKQYTGVGGQVDFVRGAAMSKGGKSLLCMPSTADGGKISKITTTLPAGTIVTTTRNDVDYIVTEYGYARLKGLTNRERARALINIAHPNFRAQLTDEYEQLHRVSL